MNVIIYHLYIFFIIIKKKFVGKMFLVNCRTDIFIQIIIQIYINIGFINMNI